MDAVLNVVMSKELKEKLTIKAKKLGLKPSTLARMILTKEVEKEVE